MSSIVGGGHQGGEANPTRHSTPTAPLASQTFWRAMDAVDVDAARPDATHVFTDIATPTPSTLARRGHNKQKRNDLRPVNVAVLATVADHVPLGHTPYPGDVPDPTAFGQALDRLDQRYRQLTTLTGEPITLVFDKGHVSQAHMTAGWARGWSVVSTWVPSHHKDLLAVPGLHGGRRGPVAGSPGLPRGPDRVRPRRARGGDV